MHGRPFTLEGLRMVLAQSLPDFMIPGRFIVVEELPHTTTGKVDRTALPAPQRTRPELITPYVAPRTALEQTLADMWASALDLDRVGVNDPFLDLGGHSLLATELISRISKVLGQTVSIEALFDAPTVARMAALVEDLDGVRWTDGTDLIEPLARERYQTARSELDDNSTEQTGHEE